MRSRFARVLVLALLVPGLGGTFLAVAAADTVIVSRVEPEFPREAMLAGAASGRVKARMMVDAAGEVTRVEIVDADPHRLFDRAVMRSLSQWRFNPGADARSYEIEIDFHR